MCLHNFIIFLIYKRKRRKNSVRWLEKNLQTVSVIPNWLSYLNKKKSFPASVSTYRNSSVLIRSRSNFFVPCPYFFPSVSWFWIFRIVAIVSRPRYSFHPFRFYIYSRRFNRGRIFPDSRHARQLYFPRNRITAAKHDGNSRWSSYAPFWIYVTRAGVSRMA